MLTIQGVFMQKVKKIIITFTLYILLCIPAFAEQQIGGFVSNTPQAAGPDASIGEVWMKHGGARLQYDALMGSVQRYNNGRTRRDPALIKTLPPLFPQKKYTPRKVSKVKKSVPMAKSKPNSSHKPTLKKNYSVQSSFNATDNNTNTAVLSTPNTNANSTSNTKPMNNDEQNTTK